MTTNTRSGLDAYATDPMRVAAELEAQLRVEPMDPLIAIELAVLYFEAQDFGVAAHLHLSGEWAGWAKGRLYEVLAAVRKRFPEHSDVAVWDEYIRMILDGGDEGPFLQELERVCQRGDSDLPFVFLFPHDRACEAYRRGAQAVYERVKGRRTPSQGYLASILQRYFGPKGTHRSQLPRT